MCPDAQLEDAFGRSLQQFNRRQRKMKGIFLRLEYSSRNEDHACRIGQSMLCVFKFSF
jgi:hypothetical protein